MGRRALNCADKKKKVSLFGFEEFENECFHPGGLFASVGQMGMGFGMSSTPPSPQEKGLKIPYTDLYVKYVSPEFGFRSIADAEEESQSRRTHERKCGRPKLKLKVKVANSSLRRLVSGAIAGAVSRTTVAPLETIRTHLMVGNGGNSMSEVFHNIMTHEGWTGLFRGNLVNVIRVAPSRAIEVSRRYKLLGIDV